MRAFKVTAEQFDDLNTVACVREGFMVAVVIPHSSVLSISESSFDYESDDPKPEGLTSEGYRKMPVIETCRGCWVVGNRTMESLIAELEAS